MAITVSLPPKPTIYVNGVARGNIEVQNSDTSFTGNRTPVQVTAPATITFSNPDGATVRYTFNSKKVNLGSKVYNNPIVVRENGNGFNSGTLTIRAKTYLNGQVSGTSEVVVKLV